MANDKPIKTLTDDRIKVVTHPKKGAFQCIEITPTRRSDRRSMETNPSSYEVQHYTLCDGWVNTWTISEGDDDPIPQVFATRDEAQAELDEFLRDIQDEIDCGDRAPDEGYDASEFRIVDTETKGGAS